MERIDLRGRRFVMVRTEDVSGSSGTGWVANGVEFPDGTCVIHWNTEHTSTAIYANVGELLAIHGHNGATTVKWID